MVLFLLVLIALGGFCPQPLFAHGVGYQVEARGITVKFFYSDGAPFSYAKTYVYSPENDKIEYQNGRTDKNGCFAFRPNIKGKWRVAVNDGRGHAIEAIVMVSDKMIPSKEQPKAKAIPKFWAAILGVSLIFNLFGIVWWYHLFHKGKGVSGFRSVED